MRGKRRLGLILLLVALLVLGALRWRQQFRTASPPDGALGPAAGAPAR
ncbi:MAG TPA: hypothetical protein VGU03_08480 [Frateuria sp.]|nr:hypothetical protein [Frateuria sp.]